MAKPLVETSNVVEKPHYFILDTPAASPAKCGLCGFGDQGRKYLDPRLDFEFYGSLIFCEACVGTMANDFGFLQPAQSREILSRLEEAERELITLRSAILHLENFHDAISGLNPLFGSGDSPSLPVSESKASAPLLPLAVGAGSVSAAFEGSGDSKDGESPEQQRANDLLRLAARSDAGDLTI